MVERGVARVASQGNCKDGANHWKDILLALQSYSEEGYPDNLAHTGRGRMCWRCFEVSLQRICWRHGVVILGKHRRPTCPDIWTTDLVTTMRAPSGGTVLSICFKIMTTNTIWINDYNKKANFCDSATRKLYRAKNSSCVFFKCWNFLKNFCVGLGEKDEIVFLVSLLKTQLWVHLFFRSCIHRRERRSLLYGVALTSRLYMDTFTLWRPQPKGELGTYVNCACRCTNVTSLTSFFVHCNVCRIVSREGERNFCISTQSF